MFKVIDNDNTKLKPIEEYDGNSLLVELFDDFQFYLKPKVQNTLTVIHNGKEIKVVGDRNDKIILLRQQIVSLKIT